MALNLTPQILSQVLGFPIQKPPPGVTPNFVNPDSTAYQVYITAGVCLPLMLVFSGLRLATILKHGRKTYIIDEVIYALALALCLAFIAMTLACLSGSAFGRHAWDVLVGAWTKSQLVLALLVEIFGPLGICAIKVSVLLLYLRVFGGRLRWMRITSIAGIVLNVSYHISLSIAFGAMCAPSPGMGFDQFAYLAAFVSDKCTRTKVLVVIQGVGNVVIDFFLLLLPLPAIWNLQMPLRQKIKTSAMFLIGICACVSSLIGLAYRVRYYSAGEDEIRLVIPIWATNIAEMAAGVVICCGPPAAIVYRSAKEPLMSWISSIRLPLASSSRSLARAFTLRSGRSGPTPNASHTRLEGSQEMDSVPDLPDLNMSRWLNPGMKRSGESLQNAWMDAEADTYPLRPLSPTHTGIGKTTEFRVSRTG